MNSSTYRFKSKLFNLFNRQSLLFKEHIFYQSKRIKIVFKLGIQLIVYPIYFLVHTKKNSQKRFGGASYLLNVSFSNTDFYLEKILKKVHYLLSDFEKQKKLNNEIFIENDNITSSVQGLASNLITHKLILVTNNNLTIDVLSENQIVYLCKYINLQLDNYTNNSKYSKVHDLHLITKFFTKQNSISFLMSLFWRLMLWMKSESLAINLNCFGELSNTSSKSENLLEKIQRPIANDFSRSNKSSLYFLIGKILQKYQGYLQNRSYQTLRNQSNQFSLRFLVYTTIYYFLSQILSNEYLRYSLKQKKINLYKTQDNENRYMWLSWDKTYNKSTSSKKYLSQPSSLIALSNDDRLLYEYNLQKHKANCLDVNQAYKGSINSQLIYEKSKRKREELTTNYTEVGIKSRGYVKHPLTRILELLDIIIFWIEQLLVKIWTIVLRILNYKE